MLKQLLPIKQKFSKKTLFCLTLVKNNRELLLFYNFVLIFTQYIEPCFFRHTPHQKGVRDEKFDGWRW
jgi:hypothetical protein